MLMRGLRCLDTDKPGIQLIADKIVNNSGANKMLCQTGDSVNACLEIFTFSNSCSSRLSHDINEDRSSTPA